MYEVFYSLRKYINKFLKHAKSFMSQRNLQCGRLDCGKCNSIYN